MGAIKELENQIHDLDQRVAQLEELLSFAMSKIRHIKDECFEEDRTFIFDRPTIRSGIFHTSLRK